MPKLLSIKALLCFLGIILTCAFPLDFLYSQVITNPSRALIPSPSSANAPAENTTPTTNRAPPTKTPPSQTTQLRQTAPTATPTEGESLPAPLFNPSSGTRAPSRQAAPAPQTIEAFSPSDFNNFQRPSLISQAVVLSFLSLFPFIIMILTSFLKIVVVLSLLRTALGVQQAPPNQVINGVAFLLSLFIMYPTGIKMYDAAQSVINTTRAPDSILSTDSSTYVIEVARAASEPMRDYLKKNSSTRHQALFYRLAYRGLPEQYRADLKPDDFIILVPAYITGQLKDAFEIGVLIYIPFFVIDLVTSNILLAMGMMMLSPVTISMPLKLFLLVMLDGWTILIEGLVKTFQ
jgi:type III secretion protein R